MLFSLRSCPSHSWLRRVLPLALLMFLAVNALTTTHADASPVDKTQPQENHIADAAYAHSKSFYQAHVDAALAAAEAVYKQQQVTDLKQAATDLPASVLYKQHLELARRFTNSLKEKLPPKQAPTAEEEHSFLAHHQQQQQQQQQQTTSTSSSTTASMENEKVKRGGIGSRVPLRPSQSLQQAADRYHAILLEESVQLESLHSEAVAAAQKSAVAAWNSIRANVKAEAQQRLNALKDQQAASHPVLVQTSTKAHTKSKNKVKEDKYDDASSPPGWLQADPKAPQGAPRTKPPPVPKMIPPPPPSPIPTWLSPFTDHGDVVFPHDQVPAPFYAMGKPPSNMPSSYIPLDAFLTPGKADE